MSCTQSFRRNAELRRRFTCNLEPQPEPRWLLQVNDDGRVNCLRCFVDHDIESLRLRLEQIVAKLQQLEENDMHFDAGLVAEMRLLVAYFRNQGFTIRVTREARSLNVRIEKEQE